MFSYLQAGCENKIFLHINKHYFTIGEQIWFTMYSGNSYGMGQASSIVVKLLKLEDQYQKMVKAVKIACRDHYATGYLDIPESLKTGYYALAIFPDDLNEGTDHILYQQLFIFNPNDSEFIEEKDKTITIAQNLLKRNDLQNSGKVKVILHKEKLSENKIQITGALESIDGASQAGTVSVSVVDKDLVNIESFLPIPVFSMDKKENKSEENKAGNYIVGSLKIDSMPAGIKKLYFFGYQGNEVILDKYITDSEGTFYFPNTKFSGEYDVKFLTSPDNTKTYEYVLDNQLNLDSIHNLGINPYIFQKIDKFVDISLREYLIKESYTQPVLSEDSLRLSISDLVEPSKVVILDEYINFPTLPEVIREIVPYTTIRFKKGQYILRINDQRAKDFCCDDDPLIFVNNEPYIEVSEIMNLTPGDIYSIEVIRPVEAIKSFGDIGINGILLINLKEGVENRYLESKGKAYFRLLGDQVTESYDIQYDAFLPDFRSFLYWEGEITTNSVGEFSFDFKPSLREGEYYIVICGRTINAELFFDIQEL